MASRGPPDVVCRRASENAARLLSALTGRSRGGTLEVAAANADLGPGRIAESLERSRAAIGKAAECAGAPPNPDLVERLLGDAAEGLSRLAQEGAAARLSSRETFALEAVIETDGSRPVLFVRDNAIDLDAEQLGSWQGQAVALQHQIARVAQAVGRVDAPHRPFGKAGTAFMIAPGLVVTNRHVLEGLADWRGGEWRYRSQPEIEFRGEEGRDASCKFRLGQPVLVGPDAIEWTMNLDHLDLAVLPLEGSGPFPDPLSFEKDAGDYVEEHKIQVIGFPGAPNEARGSEADGPPPPGHEYRAVIDGLFAGTFGLKRWAPGTIRDGPGELPGDGQRWAFSHDATTLAGSSGSCIADFADNGERVLGLHFGGISRRVNYAHAVAQLQEQLNGLDKIVWM